MKAERDIRAEREGKNAPAKGDRRELYRHPTVVFSVVWRPRQRPVVHNVGSPMRQVHSLPCYESPAHLVSFQRPSLLVTVCYLLGRVSRSALSVAVGDVFAVGCFAGGVHLLYSHNAALGRRSWNAICVRRVKFRLPYSPVAAEIANSSANQRNRGLRGSSLIIKIARTPPPPAVGAVTEARRGDPLPSPSWGSEARALEGMKKGRLPD